MMQPEILTLDPMYIIGTEVRTQSRLEAKRSSARIPQHWEHFYGQNLARRIPDCIGEDVFGIYTHYVNGQMGEFSHIIGVEVASLHCVPSGMVGLMIPEGEYMVFTGPQRMTAVGTELWREINDYFADNPMYLRAYTFDFEMYDPAEPNVVNIYVAIR